MQRCVVSFFYCIFLYFLLSFMECMKETPRRRITVTSSSNFQLRNNKVGVRGRGITQPAPTPFYSRPWTDIDDTNGFSSMQCILAKEKFVLPLKSYQFKHRKVSSDRFQQAYLTGHLLDPQTIGKPMQKNVLPCYEQDSAIFLWYMQQNKYFLYIRKLPISI